MSREISSSACETGTTRWPPEALTVADDLQINTGQGNDSVTLTAGLSVVGGLSIHTDGGDDNVTATGVSLQESANVNTGTGNDTVSLTDWVFETEEEEPEATQAFAEGNGFGGFGGLLRNLFGGGFGNLFGNGGFGGNRGDGHVEVDLGSGDDSLTVAGLTATSLKIYGGNGMDDVTLGGLLVDRLHADLGRGDDSLSVSTSTIDRMMAKLGDGDDDLTLAASAADRNVTSHRWRPRYR